MNTLRYLVTGTVWLAAIWLSGCTGVNSFPSAARAGDTVTLALGSQDGMTKANTRVAFVSDATGARFDLTSQVRAILRLYADPTSEVYHTNAAGFGMGALLVKSLQHDPWLTVMVLDLPPDLPVGHGTLHISTTAPQVTGGPSDPEPDINAVAIGLDILPGTGKPSTFDYYVFGPQGTNPGDLSQLEPRRHLELVPPRTGLDSTTGTGYGAIEIQLQLSQPFTGDATTVLKVLPQGLGFVTRSRRMLSWDVQGDRLTLRFLSPTGRLRVPETRVSLLSEDPTRLPIDPPPTLTAVRYLDLDGNPVNGPPTTDYHLRLE